MSCASRGILPLEGDANCLFPGLGKKGDENVEDTSVVRGTFCDRAANHTAFNLLQSRIVLSLQLSNHKPGDIHQ